MLQKRLVDLRAPAPEREREKIERRPVESAIVLTDQSDGLPTTGNPGMPRNSSIRKHAMYNCVEAFCFVLPIL